LRSHRDPLAFFKGADEDESSPSDQGKKHLPDPSERAIAGMAAASSLGLMKASLWAGSEITKELALKGAQPWKEPGLAPVQGATSLMDAMSTPRPPPSSKLMGLFPVSARSRPRAASEIEQLNADRNFWKTSVTALDIQHVVDSFIDKHHLAEKGVRMNLREGLLNYRNPRYEVAEKEVHFPVVGKAVMLHELGHAADYTKGTMGKIRAVAEPAIRNAAAIALPIAMIAGDSIKAVIPGTFDDKVIGFMQDHAPELMGATLAATTLYPEFKASVLAVHHVKQMEGLEAAKAVAKKLIPGFGSYLLAAIPPIVGMALARKYMRHARAEREGEGHKTASEMAGVGEPLMDFPESGGLLTDLRELGTDAIHVVRQIKAGAVDLMRSPGAGQKILAAAKEVGTSPSFVHGALVTAIPATLAALYMYGTRSGHEIRSKMSEKHKKHFLGQRPVSAVIQEPWRVEHPMLYASLVGAGAAIAGGTIAKLMHDLGEVL
jgi:hypothetical protein